MKTIIKFFYSDKQDHLIYFFKLCLVLSDKYHIKVYFSDKALEQVFRFLKSRSIIESDIEVVNNLPEKCFVINNNLYTTNFGFTHIINKFLDAVDLNLYEYDFNIKPFNRGENIKSQIILNITESHDIHFNFIRFFKRINDLYKDDPILFLGSEEHFLYLRDFYVQVNDSKDGFNYITEDGIDTIFEIIAESSKFIGNPIYYLSLAECFNGLECYSILSGNSTIYQSQISQAINV